MIYLIYDSVHDETLAATLTRRQAEEFIENVYKRDYGYSDDEIAQEMANVKDDDCDSVLYIHEVIYTDGFYLPGYMDENHKWHKPIYTRE